MKRILIFVLCSLIFSRAAMACPVADAEYIPDPKDFRLKANYYYYTITFMPDLQFVLSLIDPMTKQTETKLKMKYAVNRDADPSAVLWISRAEYLEIEFFNADLIQVPVYTGADEAPASMILRDSHAKFLTLDESGLDIDYLSPKKANPGAPVDGHLELVPDVWVFEKCLK
jgi:hypothetical protein